MARIKFYTVGQLAKRSGISVRTLHHYDEIGLLRPAMRGTTGRRVYDRDSVLRLQKILTWRTLGLTLGEIAQILDDPAFDRRAALLAQRAAVRDQITRGEALIRGIDEALALIETGDQKHLDMTALFGGFDPRAFADEAKARWGTTDAWSESERRTARYTEADWTAYHAAHRHLCQSFAALAAEGADPKGERAHGLAQRYAALIDRWFYPCDATHLAGLAEMYEADPRFCETFETYGPGTARFVIAAFRAVD